MDFKQELEEEFMKMRLYLLATGGFEGMPPELDLNRLLCDAAARAYADGNNSDYLMCAIQLNARYKEMNHYNKDVLAEITKYIDDKIAEGFEEYCHVKFAFSERSYDELLTHLK